MIQENNNGKTADYAARHLSAIVQSSTDAIISKDLEGIIQSWNAAAERIFGYSGGEIVGKPILTLIPQERQHEETMILGKIRAGERLEHYETVRQRKDGTLIDVSITVSPILDENGKVIGASKIARDVSERRRIDAISRHFVAIVESSEDTIISKDLNGIIQSWNKAAERMFGYTADEIVGKPVLLLIPPERHHEEDVILSRIRGGDRVEHFETVRQRKDGGLVEISLTVSPVKDEKGNVVGASKIARDISEQKQAQHLLEVQRQRLEELHRAAQTEIEERKRAEAARELLLHEIKHRVKNTLATVQAIATQTFREAPPSERKAFLERLQALAEAHDLLIQKNWVPANVQDTIDRAIAPFRDASAERVAADGPAVDLPPNKALLVAMFLHELGTNAVKYGALSQAGGKVDLQWREAHEGDRSQLVIKWRESGGPPVAPPTRQGFGTRMIERALTADGGSATLDFNPEGLVCTMHMPIGPAAASA
jgi:PAS domain S-box-containing protein